MKKLVVLTGAGMSRESGLKTFREADGLWEGHDVMQVASPEGFAKNPALVLDFYNQRRRQLLAALPNEGHYNLVKLEAKYQVSIITQNVDDLHERAGSSSVLHLHGELLKVKSSKDPSLVYDWKKDLSIGDYCPKNSQLRPDVVWFGEDVPKFQDAVSLAHQADVFVIIGTSMQVYPAASLLQYTTAKKIYYIDPNPMMIKSHSIEFIQEKASKGTEILVSKLLC